MKITGLTAVILFLLLAAGCGKQEAALHSIDALRQAKGAKIGVMTGTTGESIAAKEFVDGEVKSFDDVMDAVAAIKSDQLDAIVTAYPTALQVTKKNPELGMLETPLTHEDTAIAIRKDNPELLQQVNTVITELKTDGTLKDMGKRWFKSDLSPYQELSLALPKEGQPLKIGVTATREPLSFVDKSGRVTGHDGELARIIANRLGRPVEFHNMKFMALIPALQSGKVDMILTGMTATPERKQYVNFSMPYYANAQVVLLKRKVNHEASAKPVSSDVAGATARPERQLLTPQNIAGKRIGVLLGSAHDTYVTQNFRKTTVLQYKTASDLVLAVKSDKADAAVFDEAPLHEILRQNPDLTPLGDTLFSFPLGVGFSKNKPQLRKQFDDFLAQIKRDGTYDDMVERWIKRGETRMPEIKANNPRGLLRVGVSDIGLPFIAIKNNRLVGFDIEMMQRFAAHQGRALELVSFEFGSLVAAVASGKTDMIASSIFVTDERKQQIDFSTPYYQMGAKMFALKQRVESLSLDKNTENQAAAANWLLRSPGDLKDKRIGVLLGSVHDTYATQHFPNATVMQYKSPSDLVLAVRSGKVDAAIYTRETLIEILQTDADLALLGGSLQEYPIGIGFHQDNDQLREQFNVFLKSIRQDGTYDDMVERWIKRGETRMPIIANSKANGELVAGNVSDKGLPFTVVKDNRLIGFDIELAERFGAYLGKQVRYADMEFGSLIAAAASKKIDMIVSTLMLTDERKTKIDFSEPYYALGANVFALKKNIAPDALPAVAQLVSLQQKQITTEHAPAPAPAAAAHEVKLPDFLQRLVNSFNSNIIQEDRYLLIWDGLKVTIVISVFSTILGTILGGLICYMRMSHLKLLYLPARVYISIIRGTPVLVFLMLIFYVVFASVNISPVLVAVIAFGMNFSAYVSEIFRTGIQGVDKGQIEAGIAMGFTKLDTFIYITLPQTIQRILPVYKGEFISLVKMTSIVGYIAVQDLTKASDIIRSRTFDAFFPLVMIAILYFMISWILMQALEYLERKTDPKYRRKQRIKA